MYAYRNYTDCGTEGELSLAETVHGDFYAHPVKESDKGVAISAFMGKHLLPHCVDTPNDSITCRQVVVGRCV